MHLYINKYSSPMLLVTSTFFCDTLKQTNRENLCCFWISTHYIQHNHQVLLVKPSMSLVGRGSQSQSLTGKALFALEINQNLLRCSAILKDFSPVLVTSPKYLSSLHCCIRNDLGTYFKGRLCVCEVVETPGSTECRAGASWSNALPWVSHYWIKAHTWC